ncbi:MAG: hypothetical protein SPE37_01970, partial [Campylobacter sp.]|nr:hypothetical protein [Campylobacter sp.]
ILEFLVIICRNSRIFSDFLGAFLRSQLTQPSSFWQNFRTVLLRLLPFKIGTKFCQLLLQTRLHG